MSLCIYLFIHLFIYSFIHLFIYSIYLFTYLFNFNSFLHLFIYIYIFFSLVIQKMFCFVLFLFFVFDDSINVTRQGSKLIYFVCNHHVTVQGSHFFNVAGHTAELWYLFFSGKVPNSSVLRTTSTGCHKGAILIMLPVTLLDCHIQFCV